ncbi:leucine-rich repeat domain-containing protein [Streptomonospora alba]|uniref:leucine-rich repeat domain-containing protein n=1 Tax=Streptomonospora alba TaxID=183763 RepID=UPI001930F45F|nr:hypothetical protein [Streptomonospora alba]
MDLTPIGRLTRLTRLVVDVGSFEDTEPLLNLGRLRELNLKWANARSVHGFGRAFPALESLKLQGRGFRDMDGLRAIPHLTHLALSHLDQLRDLSPFAAMPRLESLRIENCENLTTLDGLGPHPRLAELAIDSCHSLHSLDGLGDQPELHTVKLFGGRSLTDLGGLARLPALHTLYINGTDLSDIDELAGSPLVELRLLWMKGLESLSSLQHCPGLKRLTLWGCPRVEDIPDSLESLSLTAADWKKHLSRIAGQENLRFLELVAPPEDVSPLLGMPSLTHLRVHARSGIITDSGTLDPVVGELRKRGVSVAIGR